MAGLTPEHVEAWVQASCKRQGVPVKVTEPSVLAQIVVLLGGNVVGAGGRKRSAGTRLATT